VLVHDGDETAGGVLARVGWEALLFDSGEFGGEQRFVYRPAGWLHGATDADLGRALQEAESIRTSWRAAR
jgi:hypothetical protein